jgi:hypothetical protein
MLRMTRPPAALHKVRVASLLHVKCQGRKLVWIEMRVCQCPLPCRGGCLPRRTFTFFLDALLSCFLLPLSLDSSFLALLRIFLDFILSQLLTELFTSYRITHLVPKVSFGVLSTQKRRARPKRKKSESTLRSCHDTQTPTSQLPSLPIEQSSRCFDNLPERHLQCQPR